MKDKELVAILVIVAASCLCVALLGFRAIQLSVKFERIQQRLESAEKKLNALDAALTVKK